MYLLKKRWTFENDIMLSFFFINKLSKSLIRNWDVFLSTEHEFNGADCSIFELSTYLEESFSSHSANIYNLLQSLNSIFKNWFDRLHNTKSTFHIIDLRLHSLNSFHFTSNFNERLTIIKSLKDSCSKCFLNIFNGSSLCDSSSDIIFSFSFKSFI